MSSYCTVNYIGGMTAAVLLFLYWQQPVFQLPSAAGARDLAPANLGFEEGTGPGLPREWSLLQEARINGYSAERSTKGCRTGAGCGVLAAGPQTAHDATGVILQQFDAGPYQGKVMRLRAWVRLEDGGRSSAIRLALTTDGERGEATFLQRGRGTDSREWTLAEVEGKIPFHAEQVQILITLKGTGRAWVDDVSFEPAR